MEPWMVDNLIIPIAGMMTGIVISIGFFKTVRHYIDRRGSPSADPDAQAEIADLQARIDVLERRHERVDELEDRLDFAERLLSRGRESDADPGGSVADA